MSDDYKKAKSKPAKLFIRHPSELRLRDSFLGGQLLEAIMDHEARPTEEIFKNVAGIVSGHRYKLDERETPMAVVEGTQKSEVNMLVRSLKRLKLMPIDQSPSRDLDEHLKFVSGEGVLDMADVRKLRGHIFSEFAQRARGVDTIVFGDLDNMALSDPAQRFVDGSFFNLAVAAINGHDKIHVREHLTALRENRAPQGTAQILEFKPRV